MSAATSALARGMASWAERSGNSKQYELVLSNYSPKNRADVEELLRLLEAAW